MGAGVPKCNRTIQEKAMTIEHILARIDRIADIIALDPKSPWNKDRAREMQKLIALARQEGVKDGKQD
jgi:hypothetical protein